jgi:hypothetical protein
MGRVLLWDVETDGLLDKMTRIHCLVIRDFATRETWRFRRHDGHWHDVNFETGERVERTGPPEDNIAEGVRMLEEADLIVGHNICGFDIHAVRKVFPDFDPPLEKVRDTLVLTRVICPDVEDGDWNLVRAQKFPAQLVGSYSLDAWGYRVGLHKGDYSKKMLALGLDPWAEWNPAQEDYCVNDVDVTEVIWAGCVKDMPPDRCVALEHQTHDICLTMERNGYFFDEDGARQLCAVLEEKCESLSRDVKAAFGYWYAPAKKYHLRPMWDDPDGINREKYEKDQKKPEKERKYKQPRTEWGEDDSRAWWAEFQFPKKNRRSKKLGDLTVGAPYSLIKRIDFNPASRPQIIDRFDQLYDWKPEEFTDAGNPSCDDAELRKLKDTIPEAEPLAEILLHKKLIGMISTGKLSWLSCLRADGMIHAHTNCGGTVSGRASHNHPNIGQVPAVVVEECVLKDGSLNPKLCTPDGILLPHCFHVDGTIKKKAPLLGRAGEYGWECRKLFYTPGTMIYVNPDTQEEYEEVWTQLGVDLSGIEFRCLAEQCADFDHGELIEVVLSGDIHQYNMDKTGIKSRDIIKRILYGLLYGAGDWKLGHTADPLLTDAQKKQLGGEMRATLMKGVPALDKAIKRVQAEAERGYLFGLDGRKLKCRATYSALNLRLQSDAALIAKKWLCLTEEYLLAEGLNHGWSGDFAMLCWVHDEIQNAIKKIHAERAAELTKRAAADAGKFWGYRCPVSAEHKIGNDWAECH